MMMKSKFIWTVCISPMWQVLVAVVVCLSGLCKNVGLPRAGHSWVCNESTADHNWAHQQNVWQPWQNIFKKGRKWQKGRDRGKKKVSSATKLKKTPHPPKSNKQTKINQKKIRQTSKGTPKSEMKEEEEMFHGAMVEKVFPAECGGPMLEQGKRVRRKELLSSYSEQQVFWAEQQRGTAMYWP